MGLLVLCRLGSGESFKTEPPCLEWLIFCFIFCSG